MNFRIFCYGEILWDCFPYGRFLGGAPLNTSYHLKKLGGIPYLISSVGKDSLGQELLQEIGRLGLSIEFIPPIAHLNTGVVEIILDHHNDAIYKIKEPVAWDKIDITSKVLEEAKNADCLIYSTLALRREYNRRELKKLLKLSHWFKIFDANLRSPYDNHSLFFELALQANLIKLNEEELLVLTENKTKDIFEAAKILSFKTNVSQICVTKGAKGAGFLDQQTWIEVPAPQVRLKDTVGAGDAFLAALSLYNLSSPSQIEQTLKVACKLGSFVASCKGATPEYNPKDLGI